MRQGRHSRRLTSPTAWIAAAVAACVAGVVVLSTSPAEAKATTVPVQLTLSGVASSDNPTGGAVVGIHPGDSVVLKSSAVPTAGVPAVLGTVVDGLLSQIAGFQVVLTSGNLPGVSYPVKLGKVAGCASAGGKDSISLSSLAKGTYNFKYVIDSISAPLLGIGGTLLGGCKATQITPTRDQLGKLTANNVKISDNAVYTGSIVAATDPPKGGLGVQLPSHSASIKVGPLSTSVNVPGVTLTAPNPLPGITSKVGGIVSSVVNRVTGGGKSTPTKGGTTPSVPNVKYTPPALTVPQKVMPHANNVGGAGGRAPGTNTGFAGPAGSKGTPIVAPKVTSTAPNPNATSVASSPAAKPAGKTVDIADRAQLGGQQLPALLAIAAILALSLVTAAYARLVLLRRKPNA